jgi:ribosome-associated protein
MKRPIQDISSEELADLVITGLLDKKGVDIVRMDLRNIRNNLVDFYVICQATSVTQAEALSDSVFKTVADACGLKPIHVEGMQQRLWILMDYFDVVVHIFTESTRSFYRIEELWADADLLRIDNMHEMKGKDESTRK